MLTHVVVAPRWAARSLSGARHWTAVATRRHSIGLRSASSAAAPGASSAADADAGADAAAPSIVQRSQLRSTALLPKPLTVALRGATREHVTKFKWPELRTQVHELGRRYRLAYDGHGEKSLSEPWDAASAAAYSLARLPGAYAACHSALSEVDRLLGGKGGWLPKTVLDAGGGGLGEGLWAAWSVWDAEYVPRPDGSRGIEPPQRYTGLQPEHTLLALAGYLCHSSEAIPSCEWLQALPEGAQADAVIAAYSHAAPATGAERARAVAALWEATAEGGVLVIVERGTEAGAQYVNKAREQLLATGDAGMIAPCTHSATCSKGCTFNRSYHLTADQRALSALRSNKGQRAESFSYVAVRKYGDLVGGAELREAEMRPWSRLVGKTLRRHNHVILEQCRGPALDAGGRLPHDDFREGVAETSRVTVAKSHEKKGIVPKKGYAQLRKARSHDMAKLPYGTGHRAAY